MMDKEKLEMKVCEHLPFHWTLFEKDGLCEKGFRDCQYFCSNGGRGDCYKKTYTADLNFVYG